MKFGVLAVDYDGTIAEDGALAEDVRAALAEVRERDVLVVVATGRILEQLRDVAGDLSFADAIVAENGAVLALPEGPSRLLTQEASPALVRALRSEGIDFTRGRCVVEADAAEAARIMPLVRSLELPLVPMFNRRRMMLLPYGVCKSAGLREALRVFRLSARNALAIGDAENDHDLLQACEFGAAVQWGSRTLQEAADDVVPGTGPADLAPYLRAAIARTALPRARTARRTVTLGRTREGRSVSLAMSPRNLVVAGDPRSGKSWVTGLLCEQIVGLGYSLCIVDPEGDYASLEGLPGVVAFGGPAHLPPPLEITRALHHPDLSVVVDLSRLPHQGKTEYLRTLLPDLGRFRGRTGLPHRIVIDEAHYFLDTPDASESVDFELGGYTLVTHRLSDLHAPVAATAEAVIVPHASDPRELAALAALAGVREVGPLAALLRDLSIDEAALVRATRTEPHVERFRIAARITAHVRHRAKYRDVPLPADRGFVFTSRERPLGVPARTLRAFVDGISRAPADAVAAHAERGDFSRWIEDVFGDRPLAVEVAHLEEQHRRGAVLDLATALVESVSLRYEVTAP